MPWNSGRRRPRAHPTRLRRRFPRSRPISPATRRPWTPSRKCPRGWLRKWAGPPARPILCPPIRRSVSTSAACPGRWRRIETATTRRRPCPPTAAIPPLPTSAGAASWPRKTPGANWPPPSPEATRRVIWLTSRRRWTKEGAIPPEPFARSAACPEWNCPSSWPNWALPPNESLPSLDFSGLASTQRNVHDRRLSKMNLNPAPNSFYGILPGPTNPMRRSLFPLLTPLLITVSSAAELPPPPDAPKTPVADVYNGVTVVDNYRWLENSGDAAVQGWSKAQNTRTRGYLDSLPHGSEIRARVDRLIRSNSVNYL